MKTFILNIPNEIRNWSNRLDAETILQSNSWNAINEDGVKEVYIFESNGQLLISRNGAVSKARWSFKSVNASIVIDTLDDKSYMLIPACYDKKVLTLQVDGTNQYAIFVSQKFVEELQFKSIADARLYICDKSEYDRRIEKEKTDEANRRQFKLKEAEKQYEKFIETKVEDYMKSAEYQGRSEKRKKIQKNSRNALVVVCLLIIIISWFWGGGNGFLFSLIHVFLLVFLYWCVDSSLPVKRDNIEREIRAKYPFKKQ